MTLVVRPARPGDGKIIHAMALELARSHGHEAEFFAVPDDFEAALFRPGPVVGAFIAEIDAAPAGSAFWHRSFTTFMGREVIYMEDLLVLPGFQRQGVGKALLKAVAQMAVEKGFPSVYWLMMDWNDGARKFYESTGAEFEDGMSLCRLHGEALSRLAE